MSLLPPPRLLVFDLDGTLIDSGIDLCNSVNATLAHFGKPQLPQAVIASYIGDGASLLVRRAFGDPELGDAAPFWVTVVGDGRPGDDDALI